MTIDKPVPITKDAGATMLGWEITRSFVDPWRYYQVVRLGAVVADAKWIQRGEYAELHNQVYLATPQVVKWCMRMFGYIQADCKAAGVKVITAGKMEYDPKFMRYLELAGFQYFGATKEI